MERMTDLEREAEREVEARRYCIARAEVEDTTLAVVVLGREGREDIRRADERANADYVNAVESFEDAKVRLGEAADGWERLNEPDEPDEPDEAHADLVEIRLLVENAYANPDLAFGSLRKIGRLVGALDPQR